MREIAQLQEIPKAIVFDQDPKFTSNFWKGLFKEFRTKLNLNTAYYLQDDGQRKIINYVIEDMLGMYVMDRPTKWENYLYRADFASK